MGYFRNRRAIKVLRRHRKRLENVEQITRTWQSQTADYFLEYFGAKSNLYKDVKPGGGFVSPLDYPKDSVEFNKKIEFFKNVIDDAIDTIENKGVHISEEEINRRFLCKINNNGAIAIVSIILSSLTSVFFIGQNIGEKKSNNRAVRSEILLLKCNNKVDSLTTVLSTIKKEINNHSQKHAE